jgi:hypothetical protein
MHVNGENVARKNVAQDDSTDKVNYRLADADALPQDCTRGWHKNLVIDGTIGGLSGRQHDLLHDRLSTDATIAT